ncbi:exocyst complex subunit Sec5 [Schizosaccharomyces japonicus yFS275]|uniref:Exocyst complex component SEC5 n=1 Tax=Schizosaccharomyces japonicus (strain yFS275 / FY16936) TaxID=402676 RepID=B6K5G3_SCHJY|nr:exocyst complex subunit Sec5 [Schizosaccharomyces japonicus yFS275]EEB08767.2 exocyst complex subunit Sec5 [Schizosaccharomyces japonicus yFS275]
MLSDNDIQAFYGLSSLNPTQWVDTKKEEQHLGFQDDGSFNNVSISDSLSNSMRHQNQSMSDLNTQPLASSSEEINTVDDFGFIKSDSSGGEGVKKKSLLKRSITTSAVHRSSPRKFPPLPQSTSSSSPKAKKKHVKRDQLSKQSNASEMLVSLINTRFHAFVAAKEVIDKVYQEMVNHLESSNDQNTPWKKIDTDLDKVLSTFQSSSLISSQSSDVAYADVLLAKRFAPLFQLPSQMTSHYREGAYAILQKDYKDGRAYYENELAKFLTRGKDDIQLQVLKNAWKKCTETTESICHLIWEDILVSFKDYAYFNQMLLHLLRLNPNPLSGRDPVLYAMLSQQKNLLRRMEERFTDYEASVDQERVMLSKSVLTRVPPSVVWRAVTRGCSLNSVLKDWPELRTVNLLVSWAQDCVADIYRLIQEFKTCVSGYLSGRFQTEYPEEAKNFGKDASKLNTVANKLESALVEHVSAFLGDRGERLRIRGASILTQLYCSLQIVEQLKGNSKTVVSEAAVYALLDEWDDSLTRKDTTTIILKDKGDTAADVHSDPSVVLDILTKLSVIYPKPQRSEVVSAIHAMFYKVFYYRIKPSFSIPEIMDWEDQVRDATKNGTPIPEIPKDILEMSTSGDELFAHGQRLVELSSSIQSLQRTLLRLFPLNAPGQPLEAHLRTAISEARDAYAAHCLQFLHKRMTSKYLTSPELHNDPATVNSCVHVFDVMLDHTYEKMLRSFTPQESVRWYKRSVSVSLLYLQTHVELQQEDKQRIRNKLAQAGLGELSQI